MVTERRPHLREFSGLHSSCRWCHNLTTALTKQPNFAIHSSLGYHFMFASSKSPTAQVTEICKGHTTAVFDKKKTVRLSKYCLQFPKAWERLKIFWWPFHSCTIFEAYLIHSTWFFQGEFFTFHCPGLVIFRMKRKPKINRSGNVMERGARKILPFVNR